ncbi:hypothetical protein I0C86_38255 [Plantactinospora sp. S1510]|uniref:Uncharacterized protein n=1 Tax=Plantactinospora alkalitolerans TaxID=2789879 RepID=A0ABS0H8D5_9ACTN|nr:hypothetical protein [Plantactinospora alkalitolerans]MBF9134733.1 hypothetical protein [Plantactinospora alkalitolerans]
MSYQPGDPIAPEHTSGPCLIGQLDDDGHSVSAVAITDHSDPHHVLPILRSMLDAAAGDIQMMTEQIMTHGWISLDPAHQLADAAPASAELPRLRFGLDEASVPPHAEWLYLLGDGEPTVLVYEATVHGTWAWHSRHWLPAPGDAPLPTGLGIAGDLATGHGDHEWRPATIGLAGLHTAWRAEICSTEWARGVIVARLDREVLRDVIDVTRQWNEGRLPGSGLPSLALVEHVLIVLWFDGSGHEQTQQIMPGLRLRPDGAGYEMARRMLPDIDVHYVIGQHVLPWVLPAEERPGYRRDELRNGVPPIREWVTETGVHTAYPPLRGYPLSLIASALADLADDGPAAVASYDHPHQVCLIAGSHALVVTPTAWNGRSHVTLPRPLGGTWTADPLVPVFSPWQVATRCGILRSRNH